MHLLAYAHHRFCGGRSSTGFVAGLLGSGSDRPALENCGSNWNNHGRPGRQRSACEFNGDLRRQDADFLSTSDLSREACADYLRPGSLIDGNKQHPPTAVAAK